MTTLLYRALRSLVMSLILVVGGAAAALAQTSVPTFTAVFSPNSITSGGSATLTFTIDNATGSPAESIAFTGTLPAGVTIASGSQSNSCGSSTFTATAGGTTMELSGGRLGTGSSCTVSLPVTSSTLGTHTFTTSALTSTLGNSGTASDDLAVSASTANFSKSYSPSAVDPGNPSTLTYTFDVVVPAGGTFNEWRSAYMTDTLPTGLEFLAPLDLTATGDCNTLSYSVSETTGALTFNGSPHQTEGTYSCTLTAAVTGDAPGSYGSSTELQTRNAFGGAIATDDAYAALTVNTPPVNGINLIKSFDVTRANVGDTVTLSFSLTNTDTLNDASGISFTDDLDAMLSGLAVTGALPSDPCGSGSALSGSSTLTLSGGSLAARGSCSFSVDVLIPGGAATGTYTNTTNAVTATDLGGSPYTGSAATTTLKVYGEDSTPPTFTKEFTDDPVAPGDTVTINYVLTNPSSTTAISDIAFSETLNSPEGTSVSSGTGGVCGGSLTAVPEFSGGFTLNFSGGSLAAGASCTIPVGLLLDAATAPGDYATTTGTLTATSGGGNVSTAGASDTLTVQGGANLNLVKSFDEDYAQAGADTGLSFTITSAAESTSTVTDISFTDDLDAMLSGTTFNSLTSDTCGGTLTGTSTLSYSGGTLDPGDSCTIALDITIPGGASGVKTNTTSTLLATASTANDTTAAAASDTISVLVAQPLTLSASFDITDPLPGDEITLTYTLTNPDSSYTYSNISFSDSYTSALSTMAASSLPIAGFCGGGTATGTTQGVFSGMSLAPGESCDIPAILSVPAGAADGDYSTVSSFVSASLNGSGVTFDKLTASFGIDTGLISMAKAFSTSPVAAGDTVDVSYTLTNLSSSSALTGLNFTDDLDAALSGLVATGLPTSTCGGTLSGTSTVSFSGGSLAAGDSCTITATLSVPGGAATGSYTGTTSAAAGLAGTVAVSGVGASAALTVQSAVAPSFSKSISPAGIPQGGSSTLTYVITNNDSSNAISNLRFTDDLDAVLSGLVVSSGTGSDLCGTGSVVSGTSEVVLSGGSLAASASCTITLTVDVPQAAALGSYTSTTSTLTEGGSYSAAAASAAFTVEPAPSFAKAFAPASIVQGDVSTLTFTIDNSASAIAATALDFTDNLPAGLVVAPTANASTTCTGGTLTATAGTGTVSYTGGTVAAGASCTVSVDLRATAAGSLINTSGDLTSSSGNSGTASDTLTATAAPIPGFSKAFADSSSALGDVVTLTFTIDNTTSLIEATALDFTDTLPSGMEVATTPDASTTCSGGTLTAIAGSGSIAYTGGTVAEGASCTISVDVTSTATGSLSNTSGDLTSSLGNSGTAAADLDVPEISFDTPLATDDVVNGTEAPALTLSGSSSLIEDGQSVTLTVSDSGSGSVSGSASVSGNAWSTSIDVSSLADGALSLTASVSDAAGTGSSSDTASLSKDATAPDGHSVSFDQSPIGAANESAASFTFAGAEVGASYSYTISSDGGGSDVTGSGTIATDQVSGLDLSALGSGTLTLSVVLTDPAGNAATAVTDSATKDTIAPGLDFDSPLASDDLVGATEAAATTISGSTADLADGQTVTVVVTDSGSEIVTGTATTSGNAWSLEMDLSALADGALSLTADVDDTAGNPASQATASLTKDSVAPTGYSVAFDQDPLSAADADAASFTFAGAEVGASYSYTIASDADGSDVTGSGTIATATDQITGIDLSGLTDGTLTLTVALTDPAGNAGDDVTDSTAKDTDAPVLSFDSPLAEDDVINKAEAPAVTLSGSASGIEDGQTVTVVVTDSASDTVTGTPTVSADAWSVTLDLSGLANGALTLTADAEDASTNPATQATANLTKDTRRPHGFSVAFDQDPVNAADADAASLSFTGAETGASFAYTIRSSGGGKVTGSGTISDAAQQITGIDLTDLSDGTLTLVVTLTDTAGNTSGKRRDESTLDASQPAATLTGPDTAQSDPFTVDLTFDEAVTGLALTSLVIDNGTASDLTGSDDSYSFTVTPDHDGTVSISLPEGAAQDSGGNDNTAAEQIEVTAALTGTPNPNPPADEDGDGIPDSFESSTADRDGDGIPDAQDYDPQGYFYCEDDGRILSGGGLTVTGPSGSNSSVGILNDINIVRDGSSGEYQWFAQRPGTYTVTYTYPASGLASTARTTSGTLDVTTLLPANPAVIGSTEFGSTGALADTSLAANPVFYDTFVIEAGDPNVLANNIPMTQCARNPVTVSAVDNGGEANGAATDSVIFTISQGRVSSQDSVISYSLGGSSTGGDDYTTPGGSVTIPAGDTQATVEITVLEDALIEGSETLTLTLTAVTAGDATTVLSTTATDLIGSATVVDDDFAVVAVSNDDLVASENGRDTAAISFWLQGQPTGRVQLSFAGDAQCAVSPATLSFGRGNFATPQTLTITAIDDEAVEGSHSCQPTVTVTSNDTRYDAYALALAQVQILDDLVDQIRDRLTEVLKSDLEETVKTQQRYFSQMSKSALERVMAGQAELNCGTQSAFDVDGAVQMTGGNGGADGTFGYDVYNCQSGSREILDGQFSLTRTENIGTQALLQFSKQRERFLSESDLRGRFWGGYVSRTNVTGLADGSINGFGINGGLYGARELGDGLFLDYYAAAGLGHHRYKLDFEALPARIRAKGSYDYAAAFAGAALSGQREYDSFLLTPRFGMDLAYASASDADVRASQLGQTDTGRIDIPDYNGGRIFAELEFASLPGTTSEDSPTAQIRTAVAPRFACEMSSFDSDLDCGFGFSFSRDLFDALSGISYGFAIDYEHIDETDRLSLDFSRERRFANGQGAVVTRLSLPTADSLQIEHGVQLDF
ncbi:MAG: Ig-like domain-containing protein [Pseudophaeobacter sp. bin_em_oilr2.035]|nr:Ig-like domain-containing protein [Pseudophaeobacter sp. bin_em_oilr2.035]